MDVYASEEEQVEAIKKWWKENGTSVIIGLVVGIGALFGWRGWQERVTTQGIEASSGYEKMLSQFNENKADDATLSGQDLIQKYEGTPYASFAALMLAKKAVEANDSETASHHLRWAIDHSKLPEVSQTASLRLARIYLSDGNPDAAWALVEPMQELIKLASYHELKGDILMAQQKQDEARNAYLQAFALSSSNPAGNSFLEMKLDDLGASRE